MKATPAGVSTAKARSTFLSVPGIKTVHNLR